MRRPLLNHLTALSLLMCITVCALWVRSYLLAERVSYWGRAYVPALYSSEGRAGLTLATGTFTRRDGFGLRHEVVDPALPMGDRHGFGLAQFTANSPVWVGTLYVVALPHWLMVAATALLPAAWLHRRRRARCGTPGLCSSCGYDLRATPERCPECGTAPKTSIRTLPSNQRD